MYKTAFRVSLFVIILMFPCAVIHAAGLGKLILNSALGQPLSAEIDIVVNNREEIPTLKASIAPREAFVQAGINYEPSFSTIKLSIESKSDGNPYIKLTSPQAINEPFLNILVELNWISGRILREYAVLLDPSEGSVQNIAAPNVNSTPPVAVNTTESIPSIRNRSERSSPKQLNRANQLDTYGPVIRGDTLSSIARQVLPAGVDLNQMLVALYRANRDAFIAHNMNLLRVGAVLKIPEKNEVASIDASTARTEIRMQVQDWHNYQSKVAATRSESPSAGIRQSDQGKIITSIEKKSMADGESAKEVLRLSSAQLTDNSGSASESALLDRLRVMEEDAIARNLALKEANERVAILEKSIENLKHLLELKDSVLAQAQVKAEGTNPEIKSPTLPLEEINPVSADTDTAQEITTQEPQVPIVQPEKALMPVSPQEEEKSLFDLVSDSIEYIGAAVILGLLIILLILKKRRSQAAEAEDLNEKAVGFSSEMKSRLASAAAAAHTISEAESNHLFSEHERNEATYEDMNSYPETARYDDEFDKNVTISDEPAEQVDISISPTQQHSDSLGENEDSTEHSQANTGIILGFSETEDQSIDLSKDDVEEASKNQIDFDLADTAGKVDQNLTPEKLAVADQIDDDKIELSDNPVNFQETISPPDYEKGMDFDDSEFPSLDAVDSGRKATEKDDLIDFELDHADINLTEEQTTKEIELPVINFESQAIDKDPKVQEFTKDTAADFDHPQEFSDHVKKSHVPELGLADIDLNIEDSNLAPKKDEISDLNEKSEQWQEVETKLDLAKAYKEMDDKEGAKEMLEEVIRDGDALQKKVAKKLLKNL